MPTPFDTLCADLNLTEEDTSLEAFERIKRWCFDNISVDSEQRDYENYWNLAHNYLMVFQANLPTEMSTPVEAYG